MPTTNLNIRTDRIIKENADKIYSELGLSMTTAVNLFLRATIRANGIPFDLKLSTDKELSEAKLLLEGIEDIKNNKLIDGEKALSNLEKKYGV